MTAEDSSMPAELQDLIRHIRRAASRRELATCSDRELLSRYARTQDEEGRILVTVATDGTALVWDLTRVPTVKLPLNPTK
jgi:hypothetical protein